MAWRIEFQWLILFFIIFCSCRFLAADDVDCLRGLKNSLADPQGGFSNWKFINSNAGFICKFDGATCWNTQENRVIKLDLRNLQLQGKIPNSLKDCHFLQTLDLSGNRLSGHIPPDICSWLPYLVELDLSNNSLTGSIPTSLGNCFYLNSLNLGSNRFSGAIPYELSNLNRLKIFSVANNRLAGKIPSFFDRFNALVFEGNSDLCGGPLTSSCGVLVRKKNLTIIVASGVVGALVSFLFAIGVWWYFLGSRRRKSGGGGGLGKNGESDWTGNLRAYKLVQVSLFKKPLVKLKLMDLMVATSHFSSENVIMATRIGTTYKAILRDGSVLAVKRLNFCRMGNKMFQTEMNKLGHIRHPNVDPLLGYCIAGDEKLVVFKYMSNGTLYSLLHCGFRVTMNWPSRLRIALGVCRGLAWLHHGCQPPTIHQNICSSVIFVDEDFDARMVDFGLGGLMSYGESKEASFFNGNLGEIGYMAPEYASTCVPSMKGDVYGLGVVLLELASGKKPLEVGNSDDGFKGNIVDWVQHLFGLGRTNDVIDETLLGNGHDPEINQLLRVACKCVVSLPKDRLSSYEVYQYLRSIAANYGFSENFDEFPVIENQT